MAPASGTPASPASADARTQLASAISRLGAGYTFSTTVSVGGQVATQASGRWIGGASEFVVTTEGTSITYRTLPPLSWVLQPGQGWVEVNGSVPSGNPLDALRAPSQVSVVGQAGGTLELTASYPPASLGLGGSSAVPVDIKLGSDGSLVAAYSDPAGSASSATTINPDPGQDPIPAPSPS